MRLLRLLRLCVATRPLIAAAALVWAAAAPAAAQSEPEVSAAIARAIRFYSGEVAAHGGYVYRYAADLSRAEGEGIADADTVWVQPPGTPAVGMAMLAAADALAWLGRDDDSFDALTDAEAAGMALVSGQMRSGGWDYSITFDPAKRATLGYVSNTRFRPQPNASGRDKRNVTTLDDDTTTAALRFLLRLDDALDGENPRLTAAARRAADAIVAAQRSNGGWPQNWSTEPTPDTAPSASAATIPKDWPRTWGNDWPGRYFLNDDVAGQAIRTLLDAYDHFGDIRYREAAIRGGEFLLAARLPEPQPGWAQQYDERMQPCWDRRFEPPAISGEETQDAVRILIELAERTGEGRFLKGLKATVAYLERSQTAPGKLARFYELGTNRPLYFTKDYRLTYDDSDVPTHYAFTVPYRGDRLWAERMRVKNGKPRAAKPPSDAEVAAIVAALDARGAWVTTDGALDAHDVRPPGGIIESAVFAANVHALSDWLRAQPVPPRAERGDR